MAWLFMLDKAEGEHKIGDMVKGFAYTDVHQKLVWQQLKLPQHVRLMVKSVVTEVRRDLGVFLDTGLINNLLCHLMSCQIWRNCGLKRW